MTSLIKQCKTHPHILPREVTEGQLLFLDAQHRMKHVPSFFSEPSTFVLTSQVISHLCTNPRKTTTLTGKTLLNKYLTKQYHVAYGTVYW